MILRSLAVWIESILMSEKDLTEAQNKEIADASKNAKRMEPAADVRQWLQDVHVATLGTLSSKSDLLGYPTNSVVPFALDQNGTPFILIAQIAAHTRNLKADNRCSLFIRQGRADGDPQAQWRATLVGHMERLVTQGSGGDGTAGEDEVVISEVEFAELKARYRERVPASDGYFGTHDFHFWRMSRVEKVRYIAGFGRICWFDGQDLFTEPQPDDLAALAEGAIVHMNEDHLDALELVSRHLHGLDPAGIKMTGLDRRGFFCEKAGTPGLIYTSFGREISGEDLRVAMVDVTRRARAAGAS